MSRGPERKEHMLTSNKKKNKQNLAQLIQNDMVEEANNKWPQPEL